MVNLYSVAWTKNAHQQLYNYYIYILRNSEQNAKKVVIEIVDSLEKARSNPQFYPPDKDKTNNDGSYRAFEKHRCRISY